MVDVRLREASAIHKNLCRVLLSAYESLQTSYEQVLSRMRRNTKHLRLGKICNSLSFF